MISSFLTGGLTVALGYEYFCIFVRFFYPSGAEYLSYINDMKETGLIVTSHEQMIFEYFIFGAVTTLLGVFFAALSSNEYIVYCLPFIVNYLAGMLIENVLEKINNYESISYKIISAFNCNTLLKVLS